MLGLWGSRTKDGNLYTGRNVDYMPDTGIAKQKLLVVHHPPRGIAHVDIGWAGVWGALAGMSAAGITVHKPMESVMSLLTDMAGYCVCVKS